MVNPASLKGKTRLHKGAKLYQLPPLEHDDARKQNETSKHLAKRSSEHVVQWANHELRRHRRATNTTRVSAEASRMEGGCYRERVGRLSRGK